MLTPTRILQVDPSGASRASSSLGFNVNLENNIALRVKNSGGTVFNGIGMTTGGLLTLGDSSATTTVNGTDIELTGGSSVISLTTGESVYTSALHSFWVTGIFNNLAVQMDLSTGVNIFMSTVFGTGVPIEGITVYDTNIEMENTSLFLPKSLNIGNTTGSTDINIYGHGGTSTLTFGDSVITLTGQFNPISDDSYFIGDPNFRFTNIISNQFSVYANPGDTFPAAKLISDRLAFGSGGETQDVSITRQVDASLLLSSVSFYVACSGTIQIDTGTDADLTLIGWGNVFRLEDGSVHVASGTLQDPNYQNYFAGAGVIKPTDESRNTTTTLTNDTDLTFYVYSGYSYEVKARIFANNVGALAGIKVGLGGTAIVTSLLAQVKIYDDVLNTLVGFARITTLGGAGVGAGLSTGLSYIEIDGVVTITTTGTLTFQWAQNVSNGSNTTVQTNSSLYVRTIR